MMIGRLARETDTKVTTIRFYESIGLLNAPPRTPSGRRSYGTADAERLHFIRNGRRLGFSIAEIRSLISLTDDPAGDCAAVSSIAAQHLGEIELRLLQLASLRDELALLAGSCTNERIASCRVLQTIGTPPLGAAGK